MLWCSKACLSEPRVVGWHMLCLHPISSTNSHIIWWVDHINRWVRREVYEASAISGYYSSNSIILLKKDRRRKKTVGDDILLMFMDKTNACEITINTTKFAVSPQVAKLSLCCWLLFIKHGRSLVDRHMIIGSPATHHNKHRKHEYPTSSSYSFFHDFLCPKRTFAIHLTTRQQQALNWIWLALWLIFLCIRHILA